VTASRKKLMQNVTASRKKLKKKLNA